MTEGKRGIFPRLFSGLILDTITTTLWNSASRSIGFLVPFFIAAWFGITGVTDVFFFAYGIIIFFAGIFTNPIEHVIVPFIAELRSGDEDKVGFFLGKVVILTSVGIIILGTVLIAGITPISSVLTKFSPAQLSLLMKIILEIVPLIILLDINSILSGALNSYKVFLVPAVLPAFRAVICICVIFLLKPGLGVHAIAAGYVSGELFRFLVLIRSILSRRLFKITFSLTPDHQFFSFLRTLSYQILGMAVLGLNPVIDKIMASWLQDGSVSIIEYADRIYMIPVTFLSGGLIVTMLSYLSSHYYEKVDKSKLFRINFAKIAMLILPVLIFITAASMLLSRQIVNIIYGHGAFPKEKLEETRVVLLYFLIGFVPYILTQLLVVEHIILKKTHTLLIIASSMSVLNVVGNLILIKLMGLPGIALSTSIVQTYAFSVLAIMLVNRMRREGELYAGVQKTLL